jgi:hypothetical protein
LPSRHSPQQSELEHDTVFLPGGIVDNLQWHPVMASSDQYVVAGFDAEVDSLWILSSVNPERAEDGRNQAAIGIMPLRNP